MRRTDAKEHVEFSVPGEEFYVTSDPTETFGSVIIEELLLPASKRSTQGNASTTLEEYGDTGTVWQYSFEDSAFRHEYSVIHVTSRSTEMSSLAFEELESAYESLQRPDITSWKGQRPNVTFQDFVKSEPRFFIQTHYRAIPNQHAFYAYVQCGYSIDGHDLLIHSQEPPRMITTLSEDDEEKFADSVDMSSYTIGQAQVADVVRALLAMNLVTEDEVKEFVQKLP